MGIESLSHRVIDSFERRAGKTALCGRRLFRLNYITPTSPKYNDARNAMKRVVAQVYPTGLPGTKEERARYAAEQRLIKGNPDPQYRALAADIFS